MIRFSTIAANADILGEDPPMAEPPRPAGEQPAAGRGRRSRLRREPADGRESGEAKPGADINAPGFVKDRETTKPS